MENQFDKKQDESLTTPETTIEGVKIEDAKPPKGFVPYQALDEERRKRKELEEKLKESKPVTFGDDDYSDEGKALRGEISSLKDELSSFKRLKDEESILEKYPQLKDKASEFKDFLEDPELKGLSLEKSAKLFLVENSMLDSDAPKRKGLERPTSGSKEAPKKGFSEEDVKRLRETQPRKYEQMLRDGRLNPDHITN